MAINPNTDFTVSAVLTASQMNRFPRGVMAFTSSTTTPASFSSETVTITGSSFTAVANRYYRITYYEPAITIATAASFYQTRIRLTNISGTVYGSADTLVNTLSVGSSSISLVVVTTLSAGTTNFVATGVSGSGNNITCTRGGLVNRTAFLLVEDIGPA